MTKVARAHLDGAANYRVIARCALRKGDSDKFHQAMRLARQCVWYARRDW